MKSKLILLYLVLAGACLPLCAQDDQAPAGQDMAAEQHVSEAVQAESFVAEEEELLYFADKTELCDLEISWIFKLIEQLNNPMINQCIETARHDGKSDQEIIALLYSHQECLFYLESYLLDKHSWAKNRLKERAWEKKKRVIFYLALAAGIGLGVWYGYKKYREYVKNCEIEAAAQKRAHDLAVQKRLDDLAAQKRLDDLAAQRILDDLAAQKRRDEFKDAKTFTKVIIQDYRNAIQVAVEDAMHRQSDNLKTVAACEEVLKDGYQAIAKGPAVRRVPKVYYDYIANAIGKRFETMKLPSDDANAMAKQFQKLVKSELPGIIRKAMVEMHNKGEFRF